MEAATRSETFVEVPPPRFWFRHCVPPMSGELFCCLYRKADCGPAYIKRERATPFLPIESFRVWLVLQGGCCCALVHSVPVSAQSLWCPANLLCLLRRFLPPLKGAHPMLFASVFRIFLSDKIREGGKNASGFAMLGSLKTHDFSAVVGAVVRGPSAEHVHLFLCDISSSDQ